MLKEINSLSVLLDQLQNSSKTKYKSIGVELNIPIEEFLPYAHWSSDHYTRNCIVRSEDYELILLCWEPGQKTPVHCHGGEECWVFVIDGCIEESQFQYTNELLTKDNQVELMTGGKSFMSDEMGYHSLENNTQSRAMSLHLYMDPIDDCTVYDKHTKEFIPRALTYFSYKGILESLEV